MPETPPRRGARLHPVELASAAVMAALCSAVAVVAVALPFGAGLSLLGTVPMGLLAFRHRLRVLVAATVAGVILAFLVIGLGGLVVVAGSAYIGGLVGVVKRRGKGALTAFAAALAAGTALAAFSVAVLMLLSRMRTLLFETITATVDGAATLVSAVPAFARLGQAMRDAVAALMQTWPVLIIGLSIAIVAFVAMVGWWALNRVLRRLSAIPDVHKFDVTDDDRAIAPVPITLREARFRYPGADHDAVGPVTMTVTPGEHLAVTGANGSGKTTLMLLLAGRTPTSGTLERPGAVGLGRVGGTAVVLQHPETQVLGTRVVDDVVWGLPPGTSTDVDRLLTEVGLGGLAHRDTGGLSGGQLQRLAVAGALARRPQLLIADEITSMVDQAGRDTLIEMLAGLTRRHDTTLVHITHYTDESGAADRIVNLTGNADNIDMVTNTAAPTTTPAGGHHSDAALLQLSGVSHRYGLRTPWESTALRDIDLAVGEGDGVLIHGLNGSGKSTLAWIMAGLLAPTAGTCLLDGKRVSEQIGAVAVAFQAARLQLMRSRVGTEIAAAAGFDADDIDRVTRALATVGLDPAIGRRRIDQLSGGQMRRVVLAGLLARNPRAIILDEPLAGLDAASRRGMLTLLTDLRRTRGLTVIVISHDFSGLDELCPRTLHLRDGTLIPTPAGSAGAP
ncbi:MAG: ATP-binding cassette domain-containing protein [Actinobacteria bacterium]|nr:ATP-binding cassette domain-containing protein [Actinomycetota bacterium]MBS1900276.1 ATP-binding cassette domain-containing protein [Actinomycetota bacterium]